MLKNYFNLLKFIRTFKKQLSDHKNKENMNELIELAIVERGVLYKLLQNLYPEKLPAHKVKGKFLSKNKSISLIEKKLNLNFHDHFQNLSEPLFCASIGQVHKAELKQGPHLGQVVAIKIQYPDVKHAIESQIKFLKLAALGAKFSPIAKWNIATQSHIEKIEARLDEELNYRHELSNLLKAQSFNSCKKNNPIMAIEKYCSSEVFTQSWISGYDLHFINENWSATDKKVTAELLVDNFLKQIFSDGFFQGDTNISNFIFQKDSGAEPSIQIHWIDFGNWCELSLEVRQSVAVLVLQTINNEEINYLGHFERIGFDLKKLSYLQNLLPVLVSILFEPFLINRPYDLATWKMDERIDALLGENKWWFRSGGNSAFMELMKSFYGIIAIVNSLKVNINWQKQFLKNISHFNTQKIDEQLPVYENNIPTLGRLAKNLIIEILKDSNEHVKIELPATVLLDLENYIPDEVKVKLAEQSLDIQKIKQDHLQHGLIPGEVFSIESVEKNEFSINVLTKFHIYLT